MDPLTAMAASGLRARLESLDMLANNIANATSAGYKADREAYSLYVGPNDPESASGATMPLIERPWIDFAQGILQPTGNPLDLALSGPGLFAVNGPSGPLYTRNGKLQITVGGTLATAEGYPVRSADGAALKLDPAKPVEITPDGSVLQSGVMAGRLAIVDFDAGALVKRGGAYFQAVDPSRLPSGSVSTSVEQGRLETSNGGAADAAVRLVAVMRQFEMLQKAAETAGEMNRKAIAEVAKVGA